MVVFFWVDVVNVFLPEFFCHFWGQTHWEIFWKKIQLILQFFWEEFTKIFDTKNNNISMYIF